MNGRPLNQSPDEESLHALACAFVLDNLEAYALGALDAVDRDAVEQHIRWCPECRDESEALQHVANLLPLALPLDKVPHPESATALLDRIAREDSEPGALMTPSFPLSPMASAEPASAAAPPWQRFVPAALVAPLVIALLVVGAWANSMRNDLNDASDVVPSEGDLGQTMIEQSDMMMFAVESPEGTGKAGGQIGLSESDLMGMAVGWDFDPAMDHEVWAVTYSGKRMMVCELYVDQSGAVMQTFSLTEKPSSLRELYISDESGEMMYMLRQQPASESSPDPPDEPTAIN